MAMRLEIPVKCQSKCAETYQTGSMAMRLKILAKHQSKCDYPQEPYIAEHNNINAKITSISKQIFKHISSGPER
jgi:hypothetical protein